MIEFEGQSYPVEPSESVLECLERHGVAIESACRSGACQACLLRAVSGTIPQQARAGLKPSFEQQGFFLACVCRPTGDLRIERCGALPTYRSRVARVELLSPQISRVWLTRPGAALAHGESHQSFEFRAGQFVQLLRPRDGLMRPYSVASLPDADELELHVARLPRGQMSSWLEHAVGEAIDVRGPYGDCCYREGEPDRPLLLAGTGTGLSPLAGIVKAAARHRHRASVTLFHGATRHSELYLRSELEELLHELPSLRLFGSVLAGTDADIGQRGRWCVERTPLDQLVFSEYPKLDEHRLYFCGEPDLVRRLKKRAYLAGAPLGRIHSDAFFASTPA